MPPNKYCPSPDGTSQPVGRIASFLQECLDLSPAAVRGVGITITGLLGGTSPNQTITKYRIPADQELVIFSIHGFVSFTSLNTEPTAILGWLNLDPSERWFVKAQNCTVGLKDFDRGLDFFDGDGNVPMSAISPPVGAPMFFHPEAPAIVNAAHSLQATFALQDTTAAIVGNATKYGIILTGNLIPNRPA